MDSLDLVDDTTSSDFFTYLHTRFISYFEPFWRLLNSYWYQNFTDEKYNKITYKIFEYDQKLNNLFFQ